MISTTNAPLCLAISGSDAAGLTIAVALLSLLTDRPCRRDTALTGELTLTGRILPVGAVKEKVLAAHRAGVKSVIFPKKNEKNLEDIPDEIKRAVKIITVDEFKESLEAVFKATPH